MIQLVFNEIFISTNKLYVNIPGQGRRFVSPEGKKFKQRIFEEVKNQVSFLELKCLENKKLKVVIIASSMSWLLKDEKTLRKKDIENVSKAGLDSIFSSFNSIGVTLDDSQIWQLTLKKEVATNDKTTVIIEPLE